MTESLKLVNSISPIAKLLEEADHFDARRFTTERSLEEFAGRMVSYQPGWLQLLHRIRGIVAKLMGLKHGEYGRVRDEAMDIDFNPGGQVDFFGSVLYEPEYYWIGEASDKHLTGYIGVISEPVENGTNCIHSLTIVKYNNWKGPVYFNLIRPFHFLIVYYIGRYAAK